MFNFFRFKTEDEFIASVSKVKEEIKEDITNEIKYEVFHDFITENSARNIINSVYDQRYGHFGDKIINNTLEISRSKKHFEDEIDLIKEENKILKTKIETLLSVLRVNAKIED